MFLLDLFIYKVQKSQFIYLFTKYKMFIIKKSTKCLQNIFCSLTQFIYLFTKYKSLDFFLVRTKISIYFVEKKSLNLLSLMRFFF
jgi:hypothetical protein